MVMYGLGSFLYVIFVIVAWVMTLYTANFYYLAYQARHNAKYEKVRRLRATVTSKISDSVLPVVTIQLPLYNEKYVAARLIDAVCLVDYPKEKLEIQVLDDSDDDTVELIKGLVKEYKSKGFDIKHLHRDIRASYKAGALKAATREATGEFIAIFDADFIPPPWFLREAVTHFADPEVGFVQCRWGHINENYSSLTEAQAISLDFHFLVEQKAKSLTHLFMNFNGTAGIWRKSCIFDAGGWHTGTLVEDLDLSYRAQLKGWKCLFLEDIVVNAELPVQMNAAKRQQFRWAKGSMQVALKLVVDVIVQKKIPIDTKIQAFIQLTRHIVNPLFLVQFLIFPILLGMQYKLYTVSWAPITGIIIYVLMGPVSYLFVIRKIWGKKWKEKARQYLFLMFFAAGISVNNTVAVFDAVFGQGNEFLRTPKFGIIHKGDNWRNKEYVLPFTKTTLLEIFFGLYGCVAVLISIFSGNPIFVPIIAIQTAGFIYVAYLSIVHSSFRKNKKSTSTKKSSPRFEPSHHPTNVIFAKQEKKIIDNQSAEMPIKNQMLVAAPIGNEQRRKGTLQKLIFVGILCFLAFGAAMAYYGYQNAIYPVDKAIGLLDRAESSQTPEQIANYVNAAKALIPISGNPVWSFPTARTDFGLIQNELSSIVIRTDGLSLGKLQTASYNMALRDMHQSTRAIENNLGTAMPYLYVSSTNILFGMVWLFVLLFAFTSLRSNSIKRKEEKGEEEYQSV